MDRGVFMRVSVVIPTWNRKDLLGECLRSIASQMRAPDEVVVVDDGSTDGTAELVNNEFPFAAVIRLERNRGFCVAINAGIRAASGDLLLLLNNDMTLEPAFVDSLVRAATASDAAMFAPLVLFRDEPDLIYCAGDRQLANGRPESIGFRKRLNGFEHPGRIFGVSAGAGVYRREVFERVGLFDERFAAYFEDSDLNLRARLAGFRCEYVPGAVAYHAGSASLGGKFWWRSRQCYRNHALLVLKNYPANLLVWLFPSIIGERLNQLGHCLSSARAEFGFLKALKVAMGAWLEIVASLSHVVRERRRVRSIRKLSSNQFRALLDDS